MSAPPICNFQFTIFNLQSCHRPQGGSANLQFSICNLATARKVVLGHLKAQETQGNATERYQWKLQLVRGLYDHGWTAEDVRQLFRLIDWMMALPLDLHGPGSRRVKG